MEDTDWRPSPCPACSEMREAARNPVCRNVDCVNDVAKSRMFTAPRYLWIRDGKPPAVIHDPMEVYRQADFNPDIDKFYQIGSEVKFKVSMEVVPGKRERDYNFNEKE
jgi:hypothetical protein